MPDVITLSTNPVPLGLALPPSTPALTGELNSGGTGTGTGSTGSRGTRKLEGDVNLIPPSTSKSLFTLA